jgi:hypothetical protein
MNWQIPVIFGEFPSAIFFFSRRLLIGKELLRHLGAMPC